MEQELTRPGARTAQGLTDADAPSHARGVSATALIVMTKAPYLAEDGGGTTSAEAGTVPEPTRTDASHLVGEAAGGGGTCPGTARRPKLQVPPIQDLVRGKTEKLEAVFSRIGTRIHRFPPGLRDIGGPDGRYIAPSVVALGPYHRGSRSNLGEMEELKYAAAHYFCAASGHLVEEVYGKIFSIAEQVRCCYDEDTVARFSHSQFAEMMFLDGCFLFMYIVHNTKDFPPLLDNGMVLSTGPCTLRDIFLLENQLPWLIMEALQTFMPLGVHNFITEMVQILDVTDRPEGVSMHQYDSYRPQHLLDLLRIYLTASMPQHLPASSECNMSMASLSAIQLMEMGVKLMPSKVAWFAEMSIRNYSPLFGELSISPMFLYDVTACWLVNIAALEARKSIINFPSDGLPSDGYDISSYLSLLAVLMDKEEDVHMLRARHIITGHLSNREMLEFFKAIARNLRLGSRYFVILTRIEDYKMKRRVWIVIHRFLYKHWKTVVTLLSIASVLVGIFKALYSMKRN